MAHDYAQRSSRWRWASPGPGAPESPPTHPVGGREVGIFRGQGILSEGQKQGNSRRQTFCIELCQGNIVETFGESPSFDIEELSVKPYICRPTETSVIRRGPDKLGVGWLFL